MFCIERQNLCLCSPKCRQSGRARAHLLACCLLIDLVADPRFRTAGLSDAYKAPSAECRRRGLTKRIAHAGSVSMQSHELEI